MISSRTSSARWLSYSNGMNGLFPTTTRRRLEESDPAIAFIIKLGCALHSYGTPSHRLEEMMALMLAKLGMEGQFFSTPTGIFAAFGAPEEQRTSLIRIEPGAIDLEKLSRLDEVAVKVIEGELGISDAAQAVDHIVAAPPRYRALAVAACYGIASGTSARFIGGGWREVVASALIGLFLGIIALLSRRSQTLSRVYEPVAAIIASALAVVAAQVFVPISVYITTLAGLIVLIPGLTLTVAMTELATRNLVSGTARLMGAGLVFLEIGFGVALGNQLGKLLPAVTGNPLPLPGWTEWLALMIAPLAFTVLFRARPNDLPWILVSGAISFIGARFGAFMLGPEFGVCFGALMVGMASNLHARLLARPAAVTLVPGLMLLVPGSVGFGSLSRFLERDIVSGVEAFFRMVLVAVALVTGLLLANVTLPPRRAL